MAELNKQAYAMEKDGLIYDAKHPIDAIVVQVPIAAEEPGEISRGQLLDCTDGVYSIHTTDGAASAIAAENVSYAADDTDIAVAAYVSGSFRASQVIAEPEITDADLKMLRSKGIYLK